MLMRKDVYDDDNNYLSVISMYLVSSSGLILSIIRLGGHYFIKYLRRRGREMIGRRVSINTAIKQTLGCRLSMPLTTRESSDAIQSDYINVFSSMSTESAFSAIIVINISLNYNPDVPLTKPP